MPAIVLNHLFGLAPPTEEELRVGLGHGEQGHDMVRYDATAHPDAHRRPPLHRSPARQSSPGGSPVITHGSNRRNGNPGCSVPLEQNQHDGKFGRLHPLVECLIIFDELPRPDPRFAN